MDGLNIKKQYNISMMRVAALFLIFFAHSVLFYVDNPYWPVKALEKSSFAEWSMIFVFYFVIPIFVFISGFLLAKNYQNTPQPLHKIIGSRFKRLIVPFFWIGVLWFVPFDALFDIPEYNRPAGSALTDDYQNFFLGLYTGHLWYLLALFWATLSCVLLLPIVKKQMFTSLLIILLMAFAAQLFLGSVPYYRLNSVALPILIFGSGMCFFHAKDWIGRLSSNQKRMFLTTLLSSMILLIYFERTSLLSFSMYCGWFVSMIGCVLAYYLFEFLQEKAIVRKICSLKLYEWIESNSMNYYLYHYPFPKLFFIILYPVLGIPSEMLIVVIFLLTCAATTIVVWGISRVKRFKWASCLFR